MIVDEERLVCLRDDRRVSLLHHWARPKVWSRQGRVRLGAPDPYVTVFPRVAFGRDAVLPLASNDVPWWLRPGVGFKLTVRYGARLAALGRARQAGGSLVSASARRLRGSS